MENLTMVMRSLSMQKEVDQVSYQGWEVKCYFGPSITEDNVLEYSAYGITHDVANALTPNVGKGCMQIIVDDKTSILQWHASEKGILTRKIKGTLPQFNWRLSND